MASKRNLKKDINYLASEVISDCLAYIYVHKDKNRDSVLSIIEETAELRNNLIAQVNIAKPKDKTVNMKEYFKGVKAQMFENIDKHFNELSKLSK